QDRPAGEVRVAHAQIFRKKRRVKLRAVAARRRHHRAVSDVAYVRSVERYDAAITIPVRVIVATVAVYKVVFLLQDGVRPRRFVWWNSLECFGIAEHILQNFFDGLPKRFGAEPEVRRGRRVGWGRVEFGEEVD